MKGRRLKTFRIAVSLIMITAITFLFIDRYELFPTFCHKFFLWLQFVPSVLNFFDNTSYLFFGFIVILLLTLLFGRIYCSFLCPLGVLQDILDYLCRKLGIHKRHKYIKPSPVIQYTVLTLTVASLFFFGTFSLNLLDPYSIFGKMANNFVRPLFFGLNNLLARILLWFDVYSVAPLSYKGFHLFSFLLSSFFLLLIATFVGWRGRLYCNTICPVGTFLGLISKVAVFKIRLDKATCTGCIRCAHVCKAGCINLDTKEIDYSRCVMCFNCLIACKISCIDIKNIYAGSQPAALPEADVQKRKTLLNIMSYTFASFGILTLDAQERNRVRNRERNREGIRESDSSGLEYQNTGTWGREQEQEQEQEHEEGKYICKSYRNRLPASPPGSISHEHFNGNCTACNLCVAACPGDVLQPSFLEYGFKNMLQPIMDYRKGYCNYECTKCGEVCPTGAIRPLSIENKKITQVGVVHFTKRLCVVVTEGTACGSCSEHCPTQAVTMVPYTDDLTIPEIKPEICIGCGACEHACPVRDPHVAIFVLGHAEHELAELPVIEEEEMNEDIPEEFPF